MVRYSVADGIEPRYIRTSRHGIEGFSGSEGVGIRRGEPRPGALPGFGGTALCYVYGLG